MLRETKKKRKELHTRKKVDYFSFVSVLVSSLTGLLSCASDRERKEGGSKHYAHRFPDHKRGTAGGLVRRQNRNPFAADDRLDLRVNAGELELSCSSRRSPRSPPLVCSSGNRQRLFRRGGRAEQGGNREEEVRYRHAPTVFQPTFPVGASISSHSPVSFFDLSSVVSFFLSSSSLPHHSTHRAKSPKGASFEAGNRRRGRPAWRRSPDDSPLRDGNRDRLVGLLTQRATRTLATYLSEMNLNHYQ